VLLHVTVFVLFILVYAFACVYYKKQELLTLLERLSSNPVYMGLVLIIV